MPNVHHYAPSAFVFIPIAITLHHPKPSVPIQLRNPRPQLQHDLHRQAAIGEHARLAWDRAQVRARPQKAVQLCSNDPRSFIVKPEAALRGRRQLDRVLCIAGRRVSDRRDGNNTLAPLPA